MGNGTRPFATSPALAISTPVLWAEGWLAPLAGEELAYGSDTSAPTHKIAVLRARLEEARENLLLIRERKSQFVMEADIPLDLIKQERRYEQEITAALETLARHDVVVETNDGWRFTVELMHRWVENQGSGKNAISSRQ